MTSPDGKAKAKRIFGKALAADPACADAALPLAELLAADGDVDEAIALLQRALRVAVPATHRKTTEASSSSGNNKDAPLFVFAGASSPAACNAELHVRLADLYVTRGTHAEALASYHAALALDPRSAEAAKGVDAVEKLLVAHPPGKGDDPLLQRAAWPPSSRAGAHRHHGRSGSHRAGASGAHSTPGSTMGGGDYLHPHGDDDDDADLLGDGHGSASDDDDDDDDEVARHMAGGGFESSAYI
mmetsp:Transcript_14240/g.56767  ORF Transcript_14240/g.56767 Transcript_14240/m.56767 type:complete len:243 (+) Transcript_14240:3-731(+)